MTPGDDWITALVPPRRRTKPRKTVLVRVTTEDIASGRPKAVESCPVALAMRRTLDTDVEISRGWYEGHLVGIAMLPAVIIGHRPVRFRLSRAVGAFTEAFDEGKPVQPFAFRVWR